MDPWKRTGERPLPRLAALAIVAALLAASLPAQATHNSVGADVAYVQPDELDGPDVPEATPFVDTYHGETLDPPRQRPSDQSGDRYHLDRCWNECYVGYVDMQLEYLLYNVPLTFTGDPLYRANPDVSDDRCPGPWEDTEAYVGNARGSRCSGFHHGFEDGLTGDVGLDTDLLEAPMMSQNAPGTNALLGPPTASGTYSFPFIARPYVFLFGDPHPDNPNPSPFEAGRGVFGPNPLAGGSTLTDLSGACSGRSKYCHLLTPDDVSAYDRFTPPEEVEEHEKDQARVCIYAPGFLAETPEPGPCGSFGQRVETFSGRARAGDLGADGFPSTYRNTLPGWYGPLIVGAPTAFMGQSTAGAYADEASRYQAPTFYTAVNPKVPSEAEGTEHLRCARPNILTDGDGVYGTYQADAIDVDVHPHAASGPVPSAMTWTQDPVHDAYADVASVAEEDLDALRGNDKLPAQVRDALDRGDPIEGENAEPDDQLGGTQAPFDWTVDAGVRCEAGALRNRPEATAIPGGTPFDADVHASAVSLKDPTLWTDDRPARESRTKRGTWHPELYTFSGAYTAKYDANGNARFDACAGENLVPEPEDDRCPWRAYWDAYNPACKDPEGRWCRAILDEAGYDLGEGGLGTDEAEASGVGLSFTLVIRGPVVVFPGSADGTEPYTVLGDANPTARNCVIGISTGFKPYLAQHVGFIRGPGDGGFDEEDRRGLCQVRGETMVIPDAFQDEGLPGQFSASVRWAKLTPTAEEVQPSLGGFGRGDELCVTGIWSVQDGLGATEDSQGSLELDGSLATDPFTLSDCDPLDDRVER